MLNQIYVLGTSVFFLFLAIFLRRGDNFNLTIKFLCAVAGVAGLLDWLVLAGFLVKK